MTDTIEYIISKEDCQAGIDKNGNVCSGCGANLTPIDTVDNAGRPTHWSGCTVCMCFDYGVKEQIYKIAHTMVTERHYRHYKHDREPDKSNSEEYAYWLSSQVRGTSSHVREIIGLYNEQQSIKQ
jgi:hypothetical protein